MIASIKKWFHAARPYSFFVSMATVVMSAAIAFSEGYVKWLPALLCLLFAVLAQATSNLVNDYADFKTGSDNENSLGKDRKLVSGEITPKAMLRAITISATLCLLVGLPLIYWGGWILLPFGLIIIAAAFCYSLGPLPLSYNALGDVAVILFFGIVPVTFTYYILTKSIDLEIIAAGLAMGLVVEELLIVNNIRDEEEDKLHNKVTTVGLFGKRFMTTVFPLNPLIACALGFYFLRDICDYKVWAVAVIPFIVYSLSVFIKLKKYQGRQLNELLGKSSLESLIFAATICVVTIISNVLI